MVSEDTMFSETPTSKYLPLMETEAGWAESLSTAIQNLLGLFLLLGKQHDLELTTDFILY